MKINLPSNGVQGQASKPLKESAAAEGKSGQNALQTQKSGSVPVRSYVKDGRTAQPSHNDTPIKDRSISPDFQKELEEVTKWFSDHVERSLDTQPSGVPDSIETLPKSKLASWLKSGVTVEPVPELNTPSADGLYQDMRNQLDKMKDDLGGCPNYPDGKPVLNRCNYLFGKPFEPLRVWTSKAIKNGWKPKFLWKLLSQVVGARNVNRERYTGLTQYEYCALALESTRYLKANMEELQKRLKNGDSPSDFFTITTGWLIHLPNNGSELLIDQIADFISLLEKAYAEAKESGQVGNFMQKAMVNGSVCFEARMRDLQNYYSKYGKEGAGDLDKIRRGYDQWSSLEHILTSVQEEFNDEWLQTHPGEPYERKDFEGWLLEKGLIGFKFQGGGGEGFIASQYAEEIDWSGEQEITHELLSKYLDYLQNDLALL